MTTEDGRCAEHRRFMRIDDAFRRGDLEALREDVEDPSLIPGGPLDITIGLPLVYAVYHSPLPFIRTLLELGADPDGHDGDGFPPLIAALSCSRPQPGSPGRTDTVDVIALLLDCGADVHVRGINDYTPLHMAAGIRHHAAVQLLLERGADPRVRTRIDDCDTPRELAVRCGYTEVAATLEDWERRMA